MEGEGSKMTAADRKARLAAVRAEWGGCAEVAWVLEELERAEQDAANFADQAGDWQLAANEFDQERMKVERERDEAREQYRRSVEDGWPVIREQAERDLAAARAREQRLREVLTDVGRRLWDRRAEVLRGERVSEEVKTLTLIMGQVEAANVRGQSEANGAALAETPQPASDTQGAKT